MKIFKNWFRKRPEPEPIDLMLGLNYEHEDPMLSPVPFPPVRNLGLSPEGNKKKKKVKDNPNFMVYPLDLPEQRDYSFELINLSSVHHAINIKIHPIHVLIPRSVRQEDGSYKDVFCVEFIRFSPQGISSLGPGEFVKLMPEYDNAGAMEKSDFSRLLHISSRAKSINDLFEEYTFHASISFSSADKREFMTTQEILFRPWKNKTWMGEITRREIVDHAHL
jgi:hypothetical protein